MFKYVPLSNVAAVQAVANGSLRIGTLRSFAEVEGSRADQNEGKINRPTRQLVLDGTHPNEQVIRDLIGLSGNARVSFSGSTISHAIPNHWAICFCLSPNNLRLQQAAQAIFRISDVERLGALLTDQNEKLGSSLGLGKVAYAPCTVDINTDQQTTPSALRKDDSFATEEEFRLFWDRPTRVMPQIGPRFEIMSYARTSGLEAFNTESNDQIAGLIERIN